MGPALSKSTVSQLLERLRLRVCDRKAAGEADAVDGRGAQQHQQAQEWAEGMRRAVEQLIAEGITGPTYLAERLNELGHKSRAGTAFTRNKVVALLDRLGLRQVADDGDDVIEPTADNDDELDAAKSGRFPRKPEPAAADSRGPIL